MSIQEHSFGIIALRVKNQEWEVLLVLHAKGHWAFPKGHMDEGESSQQTAFRELKEETNLDVIRLWSSEVLEEHYAFKRDEEIVEKTNTYFFAEVAGELILQKSEVKESRWLSLEEAVQVATFPEAKALCQKLKSRISDF